MDKTICIYHANCADGFTAAWAVREALGDDVEFIPAGYGQEPPDVTGADVVIVDFSYKRPVLEEMALVARSILVLDHHKTAQSDLAPTGKSGNFEPPLPTWERHLDDAGAISVANSYIACIFDMDRSGAQIAWDFFHDTDRPALVDYVADRDLWRWEMPNSREVSAVIRSDPMTFEVWDALAKRMASPAHFDAMVGVGHALLRAEEKLVDEVLDVTTRMMVIGGHRVPVANAPYALASDTAGRLAEGNAFAATYIDTPDGRAFSLRSRGPDGLDVSEIAKFYGGGGHRNASGFKMPIGWEGDA